MTKVLYRRKASFMYVVSDVQTGLLNVMSVAALRSHYIVKNMLYVDTNITKFKQKEFDMNNVKCHK